METNLTIAPPQKSVLEIRREIAKNQNVLNELEAPERAVFLASIEKPVKDYTSAELAKELYTAIQWISKDIGYRATSESDRQYIVIRTAEILKRYYPNFTMKDFRLAFEMCLTGELDEFLPKDRNGQPDRNHYQQFNADYVCKILNAYKGRRAWILRKANESAQKHEAKPVQDNPSARNNTKKECIAAFLYFKYHGELPAWVTPLGIMLYYNLLASVGLADEMTSTAEERALVLQKTITQLSNSGQFIRAKRARVEQQQNRDVKHELLLLTRRKALERTFKDIAESEKQLTNYIHYES